MQNLSSAFHPSPEEAVSSWGASARESLGDLTPQQWVQLLYSLVRTLQYVDIKEPFYGWILLFSLVLSTQFGVQRAAVARWAVFTTRCSILPPVTEMVSTPHCGTAGQEAPYRTEVDIHQNGCRQLVFPQCPQKKKGFVGSPSWPGWRWWWPRGSRCRPISMSIFRCRKSYLAGEMCCASSDVGRWLL